MSAIPAITNPTPLPITNPNIISLVKNGPTGAPTTAINAVATANPGNDQLLVNALTTTTGPGSGVVAGDPLNSSDFFKLVNHSDFSAMTNAQLQELQTLMSIQSVDMGDPAIQADLNDLFVSFATTLASVQAKYTRAGTPWEVEFGKGQSPSFGQLDNARNSGAGNNF